MKPKLRPVDFQPVFHKNQHMWYLRDPHQLSDQQLTVPQALAQMLLLLDGTRDLAEIHHRFCIEMGEDVPFDVVVHTVNSLDEACLLDNDRAREAKAKQVESYRAQAFRRPPLAGVVYPEDETDLCQAFTQYGYDHTQPQWSGRGIISPHIDYQRGGSVYAQTWSQAQQAVLDADLVVILGTDHNGGAGTLTLTQLPYATPFGVLPTDDGLVSKLAEAIGEDHAFALELNHRQEHAVELSAVWLHHAYHLAGKKPAPMIPILVGSLHQFVQSGTHPDTDPTFARFVKVLREESADKNILYIASVDFAHVGPTFDDDYVMDEQKRVELKESDASLMEAIRAGDNGRFYSEIAAVQNANKLCGFSSIYLLLRILGETTGQTIAYEQCEADPNNQSVVSIAGMLLS